MTFTDQLNSINSEREAAGKADLTVDEFMLIAFARILSNVALSNLIGIDVRQDALSA